MILHVPIPITTGQVTCLKNVIFYNEQGFNEITDATMKIEAANSLRKQQALKLRDITTNRTVTFKT